MVEEIQSEESDDDDSSSDEETPIKTNPPNRDSRSVPGGSLTASAPQLEHTGELLLKHTVASSSLDSLEPFKAHKISEEKD